LKIQGVQLSDARVIKPIVDELERCVVDVETRVEDVINNRKNLVKCLELLNPNNEE
jgi:hypothetical protein